MYVLRCGDGRHATYNVASNFVATKKVNIEHTLGIRCQEMGNSSAYTQPYFASRVDTWANILSTEL